MVRILSLVIILTSLHARADVLFEGYSKIFASNVHVGFIVSRYEFDKNKKQFVATSFIKTNSVGGDITESLKAYAKEDMTPVSYQYTTVVPGVTKTIDAKFTGNKINASIITKTLPLDPAGKPMPTGKPTEQIERVNKEMPAKTFLSTFLAYVMLKSPQGFQKDIKFDYKAIAEEDATVTGGMAYIKEIKDEKGIKTFQILNEFKNIRYLSSVTDRGDIISTRNPVQGIVTELMAQPSQATGNIPVPASILKSLFGQIPTGQKNEVARTYQAQQLQKTPEKAPPAAVENLTGTPSKKEVGIPQGKGIQVKGSSENETK